MIIVAAITKLQKSAFQTRLQTSFFKSAKNINEHEQCTAYRNTY